MGCRTGGKQPGRCLGFGSTAVIGKAVGMTVTRLCCLGLYARPAAALKPGASPMLCMRGTLRAAGDRPVAAPRLVARATPKEVGRSV
jgi:hypothetical protein